MTTEFGQVQDRQKQKPEKEKKASFDPSVDASEAERKQIIANTEEFEQKRAAHYDEGRVLQYAHQLAMASLAEDFDEDTTENRDETDTQKIPAQPVTANSSGSHTEGSKSSANDPMESSRNDEEVSPPACCLH